ncbi:MAG: CRISPR-associated helicase Cas3' [bacterium]|jgi:CRISPR-associated endonuclease/helicase Cas3
MAYFYAHSRQDNGGGITWQSLDSHLRQTAELAKKFAGNWQADEWGYLAGLWHDVGKYSKEFQERIRADNGQDTHIEFRSKVDHSTAGAQHADRTLKGGYGKAIAFAIAGHHGGLPDGNSPESCLRARLTKDIPDFSNCPPSLLESKPLALPFRLERECAGIQLSLFIRMLYSALVDADFLDTEQFMDENRAKLREGYGPLSQLVPSFFQKLDNLTAAAPNTPINMYRREILMQCVAKAENDLGLFSLTVPTGGGKTLSSMAFALRHASKHGLKRIIYVIPYTSIIEQNADVFRLYLNDNAILEHHCNFEPDEEDYRSRLASENWDAPVIVTTNVQFFESLFANKPSRCRKLHNVSESVIILDEIQTLPPSYLIPCLEVLRELASNYRTSIVLCSATQPAVQKRNDFLKGLVGVTEIVNDPKVLASALKRTEVSLTSRLTDDELGERLRDFRQVLCIVNTRNHARELYHRIKREGNAFHLSALMCPKHRSQKLDEIRRVLKAEKPCRVISTQLIEAGVDIDFPVVFRSLTGIDSIAQAAGRCNREGKLEKGQVFVFVPERGIPPGQFRQSAQAAESVIRRYSDDILSLEAIEEYFKLFYWTKGERLDEENILGMLNEGLKEGDFPFRTIAEKFQFIKDYMKPVVIPFDEKARRNIESIRFLENPSMLSRALQRYTVTIPPKQWDALIDKGVVEIQGNLFPVLIDESLYDSEIGLQTDEISGSEPERLYI